MDYPILIGIGILILLCFVFVFFRLPGRNAQGHNTDLLKAENETLKINLAASAQKNESLQQEKQSLQESYQTEKSEIKGSFLAQIHRLEDEKTDLINRLTEEKASVSRLEEIVKTQKDKFTDQQNYLEALQTRFTKDFELVANKILEEKTSKFTDSNRNNLEVLLNPLKENIKLFEEKVEKVYKAESDERNVLKGEINQLMNLNRQLSEDTHNLTRALKSDNKKQGNWGEVVLDRLLEASGLLEGESYSRQNSFTDEFGNRLQPDVLIHLPEKKNLVIDAKVSLIDYERLVNNATDDNRESLVKAHLNAVKSHIINLSGKKYQDLYQIKSPEFVLLFMPIESSFALAVQHDTDLFDFAWNKKVVIVTPSTLLATLKTIASIWKQEQQTQNALEIATKAGALYDKFAAFVDDLKKLVDQLDRSQKFYHDAMNKLSTGSGNLTNRVENLRKLGAKATKQIDQQYLDEGNL